MRWLILLIPLSAMAGDLQLKWDGTPPFDLIASRVVVENKQCVSKLIFYIKTHNNKEIVQVDFIACTQFLVCNKSGCEYLSRRTFANGLPVECKPLSCR